MSRDPIKLTIGLGFAGVLSLMGLISFISLSQMNAITEQMAMLLEETNAKISAASTMRDSIRLRGDTLYKMYLTDDYIERDEYRLKIGEYALRYKVARDKLYSFHMSAREAKLLNQLMKQTRAAKALNDTAADNLLSDLPVEKIQNDLHLANIARHDMLAGLDKLVLLQEKVTHSIIDDTKKYQETISNIILYLSLAVFFIAVYIAQLVMRETSKKNSEIRYQATHDDLTKLVNRKEFNHRLKEAINTAIDNHENHALCYLDLDNFKIINDSCGHKAGDVLLVQLTNIIKNNIRSHDTLARLGGDEFGLLLEGCSLDKAIEIAEGLVNLIKNYEFNWQDKKFHVGVSIGLLMITHETQSVEKALSEADIACYAAKDMGRNQVHIHGLDDDLIKKMHKELSWVADINNTDSKNRFSLHLQAIQNLQTDQTTSMYEVLLRLNDDEGRLVSPANYIPAAERFSLMTDVDRWVIKKTFKHLSNLYKTIPDCDIRLFINISANSLTNFEFSDFVIKQYKKYNIAHDAVCLEISEIKAIKNINQTADLISALRKYNIKFAIDDFGTGIPSFSYLKNLPVDYLKIDGNIIKNISQNTADKAMVAAINQIGKVMNIETIAKHVENIFTLNQLKEIGIDYAQGYYLDKPRRINDQVEDIIKSRQQHSVRH
jgi:diguanylate cyclase (GGDEF)-like protein